MLPNFFVVGAEKSGTTALWHLLGRHSDVFLPAIKEPQYFACVGAPAAFRGPPPVFREGQPVRSFEVYKALYAQGAGSARRGDMSTWNLYRNDAAHHIAAHAPDARIVALLRDPVERAYSRWLHMRRDGREGTTVFLEAIEREPDRRRANWWPDFYYFDNGLYHEHLSTYYRHFPADQIHVILYDDFRADPEGAVRGILNFLDIDDDLSLELEQSNASGIPGSPLLGRFLLELRRVKVALNGRLPDALLQPLTQGGRWLTRHLVQRPRVAPHERAALLERYREDINALEGLLDRSLAPWRRSA